MQLLLLFDAGHVYGIGRQTLEGKYAFQFVFDVIPKQGISSKIAIQNKIWGDAPDAYTNDLCSSRYWIEATEAAFLALSQRCFLLNKWISAAIRNPNDGEKEGASLRCCDCSELCLGEIEHSFDYIA